MSPSPEPQAEPAPLPWDAQAGAADPDAPDEPDFPGQRHDAFTEARKAKFLRALMKCGCVTEACRRAKVASRTIYNHQQSNAEFLSHCVTAKRMAAIPVEITAWSRAVDGIEETVVAGGRAVTRTRYSEPLLRMMLQASNPKKFGRNPGFSRKRMRAAERKEIERELRPEIERKLTPKIEQKVLRKMKEMIARIKAEREVEKLAEAEAAAQTAPVAVAGDGDAGASGDPGSTAPPPAADPA